MGTRIDLKGQKFERLTVLEYASTDSSGNALWRCQCDCGEIVIKKGIDLRQGKVKSCGCLRKDLALSKNATSLLGKRFGRLTVQSRAGTNKNAKALWLCQCDCGNTIEVITSLLTSGKTRSCGCLKKETCAKKTIDEVGNIYGYLTVIGREGSDSHKRALWKCKCKCGNTVVKLGTELRNGHVQSCGCIKSLGESKIEQCLQKMNIPYKREFIFPDCYINTNAPLRFDFSIEYNNKQMLIEYQGQQHYMAGWGWNTEENYQQYVQRDQFKEQYCKEHNIPLIVISYTDLDKINEDYLKSLISHY